MLIVARSPEETRAAGERLGRVLGAGDVVLVDGELGAGKTVFAQGVAIGLGVPAERRVASPTFTIVNEHPGRVPLHHIDLYRLSDADELHEIGVREYLEGAGVALVEWPERLGALRPPDALEVTIAVESEDARRIAARATGPRAAARLEAWKGQR